MKFKDEVCVQHGVRMHRKQKQAFRNFVFEKANEMGWENSVQKSFFAKNIVVGNPEKAEIIFTAHYDTPPRLPKFFVKNMLLHSLVTLPATVIGLSYLPSVFLLFGQYDAAIISAYSLGFAVPAASVAGLSYVLGFLGGANKTNFNDNSSGCLALLNLMDKYQSLPQNLKDKVAFVFTDNEEKSLLGSFVLKNRIKNYKEKTFVNMDCVGRGKNVNLYHFGNTPEIVKEFESIISSQNDGYQATVKKSNMLSLSDHYPVRKANHVCLLNTDIENKKSIYKQIHSANDYILEDENIDHVVKSVSKLGVMKELEAHLELYKEQDLSNQLQNTLEKQKENENIKFSSLKNLNQNDKSKTKELNK